MFQSAVPVWCASAGKEYNQFAGFHVQLDNEEEVQGTICIAARSYYRLYINGEIVMHGPARAAKGYCRTDEVPVLLPPGVHIAIEAAAYDKPDKYCNDCTLEPGLVAAEVRDAAGRVLTATGDEKWRCRSLSERKSRVETMSHSREIIEVYDLKPDSAAWRTGEEVLTERPVPVEEKVLFLPRRSPLPDLHRIPMQNFAGIYDTKDTGHAQPGRVLTLARMFNHDWYASIPKENQFLEALRGEEDATFTGKSQHLYAEGSSDDFVRVEPGKWPTDLVWSLPSSEVGFVDFAIRVTREAVVDLVSTDHRSLFGALQANTYVTRWHLQPGAYHLTTFEPKLVRYLRLIVRTDGTFEAGRPSLLNDTYPDRHRTFFECSDGDLNRIWEGAAKTLRLNTLDIFMDCPERERGGWLCDSFFTSRAAWQLYGDASVEKDFLENFLLTDAGTMWHGFFPEVYPGSKGKEGDPGFQSWSFWLAHELCAYVRRTGDQAFAEKYRDRIAAFMDGILELKGESGLIEGLDCLFVDWSLSNRSYACGPISVPVNCLISLIFAEMGELYGRDDWKREAAALREILEKLDEAPGIFGGGGDAACYENGRLQRRDLATESGAALELYAGFHRDDPAYLRRFIYTMGWNPQYRSDPNIGKSNLFIGLMIRFMVLEELDRREELVQELKDIYLPELRDGSGTFFENYSALSGCHGFNSAAAALLTNDVLGLGAPKCSDHTIRISPAPGKLRWAAGSAACGEESFFMSWSHNQDERALAIQLQVPEGWTPVFRFPKELAGYRILVNGEEVHLQQ